MSYTSLLESVEESARESERELKEKAERAIRDITRDAQEQADLLQKRHMEQAVKTAAAERNKALYLVRADNKREQILAKDDLYARSFALAMQKLSGIRSDPAYPVIFATLLKEALGCLEEGMVTIRVDPKDATLCKKIIDNLSIKAEIITDLTTAGGVTVTNPEGDIMIGNTIESRLERAKELLRLELSAILDGG